MASWCIPSPRQAHDNFASLSVADNGAVSPQRRSIIMLAVIIGAMALFAIVYLLGSGATPDPSPVP